MRELKKGSLGMLLLQLLRERPSYGYELSERLRTRTGGTLSFDEGGDLSVAACVRAARARARLLGKQRRAAPPWGDGGHVGSTRRSGRAHARGHAGATTV